MPFAAYFLRLLVFCTTILLGALAHGQEPVGESVGAAPTPWKLPEVDARPNSSAPDIFMLPDEEGRLRMVLGFRYQDFLKVWQRQQKPGTPGPPRLIYESIRVTGDATATAAQLRIAFDLVTHTDEWVEVSLGMPKLIVEQLQIADQQPGECLIFDEQRESYRLWLKSQSGQKRKVVVEGLMKLKLDAETVGLEITLPHATEVDCALRVPNSATKFETAPEINLSTTTTDDGPTEVRLIGHAHPVWLRWTAPNAGAKNDSSLIEVNGQQTSLIQRRRVLHDVTLKIDSLGQPLDRVRIRLPEGATLAVGPPSEEYLIVPVEPIEDQPGQTIDIRSKRSRKPPWIVHLSAEQPIDDAQETSCPIGGFEVVGALRQSGQVDIQLENQLQAYFDLQGHAEQVQASKSEAPRHDGAVAASFEYARFPWTLTAHLLPRQRRVSVRPRYRIDVGSSEAILDLELDYQLAGARTFSLRIDMRGWKLTDDPIESGGTIDPSQSVETRQGLLVLPLLNPDAPRIRLKLTARRATKLGTNSLPLPEPLGAFVTGGLLVAAPQPTVQLVPRILASDGLTIVAAEDVAKIEESGASRNTTPTDRLDLLHYHTFLPRPTLSVDLALREPEIAIAATTVVNLSTESIDLLQQFHYVAKYGPISQLVFRVPESMWQNPSLAVRLDDQEIRYRLDSQSLDPESIDETDRPRNQPDGLARRLLIDLPRPLQGTFRLDIGCQLPAPELDADAPTPLTLPLAVAEGPMTSCNVTVASTGRLSVVLDQLVGLENWITSKTEADGEPSLLALELLAGGNASQLPLLVESMPTEEPDYPTLESVWLQTWIVGEQRQDRAVYRFRTNRSSVSVQLSADFDGETIEVVLDGEVVEVQNRIGGQLVVGLPSDSPDGRHTLEFRYQQPTRLSDWNRLRIHLPQLQSRSSSAPIYWQLVLPSQWHVASPPTNLSGEYWLGWKDYRWGRQPNLSQPDLERLTDASTAAALPRSTNQYLYRAFQVPEQIELVVVRRVWLLVGGALATFGIGLIFLYSSLASRGIFWLVVALGLLGLVFLFPELVLLTVQAILWGGLMVLFTAVLKWLILSGEDRPLVPSSSFSPPTTAATTESWPHGPSSHVIDPDEVTETLRTGGPS